VSAGASERPPELLVVVDTEEEFDWGAPFDRANTATQSIPAQAHAQAIYRRLGVVPTYVIDYPVATDPVAAAYLRSLKEAGEAEIGAHLHPWVTPPHEEEVTTSNSYQFNLPPELEQAKIEALTDAIERAVGERPTIFKAGRYGLGPRTPAMLAALGYKIDCSVLAHHDLRGDGGPDFRRATAEPYWIEGAPGLLEVPVTAGFLGATAWLGPLMPSLFDSRSAAALRLPGLLSRLNLVTRSRITPEGVPAREQCRLLDALVGQGLRTFTLAYHSPSLAPANTPYVRTEADLSAFLARLEQVLTYFRDTIGGRFTTLSRVYDRSVVPPAPRPAIRDNGTVAASRGRMITAPSAPRSAAALMASLGLLPCAAMMTRTLPARSRPARSSRPDAASMIPWPPNTAGASKAKEPPETPGR